MESSPVPPQPATPAAVPPVTPIATPQQPTVTEPNANVVTDQKSTDGSKKMVWIVLVLLVLVIAIGAYFFMNMQNKPTAVVPTTNTASTSDLNALNSELSSTQTGTEDLSSDLTALDKDLAGI